MMHPAGRGIDPVHTLGTAENAAYYSHGRHPGVVTAMAWLAFSHLPEELKPYARPFYMAAIDLIKEVTTDSAELTTALNTLVEAKDWAVRAGIRAKHGRPGPVPRPTEVVDPPISQPLADRIVGGVKLTDPGCVSNGYHNTSCTCLRNSVAASGARPIKDNPQA